MVCKVITYKDAIIALLEAEIANLKDGASPIEDYYISGRDTYRFDVTGDEIRRFLRWRITYRRCPNVQPPEMALLEVETVKKLLEMGGK